jgi:GPI-anchor transamidase subunit U
MCVRLIYTNCARFFKLQVANFWLVWTLFRPTGTLYDLNVGLCLMLLSPQSMARMNILPLGLIVACALIVPILLYMVLYGMWLETGNGEANFLYFQCYAYNVFVAILFIQFTGASVERDKALRLTAAAIMKEKNQESSGTNDSQGLSE